MHPTSLASNADFDDSADMDGEKHSQSNHHQGFHRGNRRSRNCQAVQFLSLADENVMSVFGPCEPLACAPFFPLCDHDGVNTTLGREIGLSQSSEGEPSVDLDSRFPFAA